MWWKVSLAAMAGLCVGVVISICSFRVLYGHLIEWRSQDITPWSAANKDWKEFSIFLRYGGRESLLGAAHLAAEHGMSESEVRKLFGPPDHIAIGEGELTPYPAIRTKGKAGAYLYKVGPCAMTPRPHCTGFAVVFDGDGKVIDRQNLGVSTDDQLAKFENDSRSDRLIAP
jgi:hypothetical protein